MWEKSLGEQDYAFLVILCCSITETKEVVKGTGVLLVPIRAGKVIPA